jgi:N-acetylglutamate synthase-like GNAT family acetyltransferase
MAQHTSESTIEKLAVRGYQLADQRAVARLYTHGLLAGQIAPNDTGADIENMREAYFTDPANHFWIAEVDHRIVGMIGVARDEGHTAEIRRLRVDPAFHHSDVALRLIETAITHCKHHGYLKVVFDTRFEREEAVGLFDRFGFQHTRSKAAHGKEQLEFYLNLYHQKKEAEA